MWTFVGRKKCKRWLWLAVERASRRIVAWVLGDRSRATARRLWLALPAHWRVPECWYFTDLWESYVVVVPRWQHRRSPKGSGGTSIVAAINCALRQRCGVLVRNSCSFSRCHQMHTARIKIVIDNYNATLS